MRRRAFVARPLSRRRCAVALSRLASALRRAAWIGLCAVVVCVESPRASLARAAGFAAPSDGTGEYELKAQFLLRFATPYVKWPETAFEDKASPFVVGILGKDPFGPSLDELFKGKKVGEHPIAIARFNSIDALKDCHMLFVPLAQEKHLEKLAKLTKDKSVLIVAESISAAQTGAQIGFYLEKSKVRFAINPTAAKQAKLEVSSELLKLAKLVENKAERDQ